MLLAAMKQANDGHGARLRINAICDHSASAVVGHTQPLANVVARHASKREDLKALASIDHCIYVTPSDRH